MASTKSQAPLVCKCGGASFREYSKGKYECTKCNSKDSSNFTMMDLPADKERDIQLLLQDRLSEEKRSFDADKINKNLCIRFTHSEPVAIVAFGDPHLDDAGTSLSKVIEDLQFVKDNENVFGVCVGDISNNWVGRLTGLYGEQGASIAESWVLVEWFCQEIPWLAMVLGNHDKWNQGVEILKQLTKGKLVQADECSFKLNFKNGAEFTLNARHKWSGNSQWNPAHGVAKYAHFGADYDVLLGGHTHQSAYAQVLGTRRHKITHCLQLASYKMLDSYARSEGFRNHNITPSMCIVFDPSATREEDRVIVTYSIQHGLLLHKAMLEKYRKESRTETPKKVVPKTKARKRK